MKKSEIFSETVRAARETDRRLTALEGTLGELREMMRRMVDKNG